MKTQHLTDNLKAAFNRDNITLGLAFLTFICLVGLIFGMFNVGSKGTEVERERASVERERAAIKKERDAIKSERAAWEKAKADYQNELAAEQIDDSLRIIELNNTKYLLSEIDKRHEKIISSVNALTLADGRIKRAYADFGK